MNQIREMNQNALNVLTKAAELYLGTIDELARHFATPGLQQAHTVLQRLIEQDGAIPFGDIPKAATEVVVTEDVEEADEGK